jgi:hypothetical protein
MAGGIGYTRTAFVTIWFKSPAYKPFFWSNGYDVIQLPNLASQGMADRIARNVMNAKANKLRNSNV